MKTSVLPDTGGTVIRNLHRLLTRNKTTVAVAESCTGGLVSTLLTSGAGSSAFFREGLVVYSNEAKVRLLSIPAATLRRHGAVSARVACLLAEKVRQRSGAAFGLGITGIAGPGGARAHKPVGTVFIALSGSSKTECRAFGFRGSRASIRRQSALEALSMLFDHARLYRSPDSPTR